MGKIVYLEYYQNNKFIICGVYLLIMRSLYDTTIWPQPLDEILGIIIKYIYYPHYTQLYI